MYLVVHTNDYRSLHLSSQINSLKPECIYSFVRGKGTQAQKTNQILTTPLCPSMFHLIKNNNQNWLTPQSGCNWLSLSESTFGFSNLRCSRGLLLFVLPLKSWIDDSVFFPSTAHIIFPQRAPCFEGLLAGRHFAKKNVEWKALKAGYGWIINVSDLGEQ